LPKVARSGSGLSSGAPVPLCPCASVPLSCHPYLSTGTRGGMNINNCIQLRTIMGIAVAACLGPKSEPVA
jgi:hypothetical protein